MKTKELQRIGHSLQLFAKFVYPMYFAGFHRTRWPLSTSIKYFATFAVLVLQYARMLTNYKEYTIR